MLALREVENLRKDAYSLIDKGREDRITPKTAESHTDEWHSEALGYVLAELSRDNVGAAKKIVERWLGISKAAGRMPHMIVDKSSKRRMLLDRHIVQAEKIDLDGTAEYVSPLWGLPINSTMVELVSKHLPQEEKVLWLQAVLPALCKTQLNLYNQRVPYSGLPVQISPDEVLLRHGYGAEMALAQLPDSKLTDFEKAVSGIGVIQRGIKRFRHAQASDGAGQESSYDSADFMSIATAARHYTLWRTLQKNRHALGRLQKSTGRGERPDAFLMNDVAVSGLLVADNEAFMRLAKLANFTIPGRLNKLMQKTRDDFANEHQASDGSFGHVNRQSHQLLPAGIEQIIALSGASALSTSQIRQCMRLLDRPDWASEYGIPTYPVKGRSSARLIDRGATNSYGTLLSMLALETMDFEDSVKRAELIGSRVLSAAANGMSREHNSITGESLGQSNWRPTAAAVAHIATQKLS